MVEVRLQFHSLYLFILKTIIMVMASDPQRYLTFLRLLPMDVSFRLRWAFPKLEPITKRCGIGVSSAVV